MTAVVRGKSPQEDPSLSPSDAVLFEHLGIAVMLCWADLPFKVRDQILNQTNDIIGVTPIPGIRDRIVGLLMRHRKV